MEVTKLKIRILSLFLLLGILANAQSTMNVRWNNGGADVHGEMLVIGNSSLGPSYAPNDPYNGPLSNGFLSMSFIDIDNDASTFQSSAATLKIPNVSNTQCVKIKWAGLYWGSHYSGTGVKEKVKLKLPNTTTYIDITSHNTIGSGDYVSFTDVTNILQNASTIDGEYIVANIAGTQGNSTGYFGGWALYVVYEDFEPTTTNKKITIYDGYSEIGGTSSQTIDIRGFKTIPAGNVKANVAVVTMEGDIRYDGDQFYINNNAMGQNNLPNHVNNFFDSSITHNGQYVTSRRPNSTNTLGWDVDYFTLDNPGNRVLGNNATSVTLRTQTRGDWYVLAAIGFSVETIAPNIEIEKLVKGYDQRGNEIDLRNKVVGKEATIIYEMKLRNTGNDDVKKSTFEDVFPAYTGFDTTVTHIQGPPGATLRTGYPKDTIIDGITRKKVVFDLEDNLLRKGSTWSGAFRFTMKVTADCGILRDACANQIMNQAFVKYKSALDVSNGINKYYYAGSYSGAGECSLDPSPTNFLYLDPECSNTQEVFLCGLSTTLTAGNGYATYSWKKDGDNTELARTQTLQVTAPGTYVVTKTLRPELAYCQNPLIEKFVVRYDTNQAKNPLLEFVADKDVAECINDGKAYVQVPLCGSDDTKTFNLSSVYPSGGVTVKWYRYMGTRATGLPVDCPTPMTAANRGQFQLKDSDMEYTVSEEGEYAVEVTFGSGSDACSQVYYFRVSKSNYDYTAVSTDVYTKGAAVCKQGTITISGITGSNQQYQIKKGTEIKVNWTNIAAGTTATYSANEEGAYTVLVRQKVAPPLKQEFVCEYKKSVTIRKFNLEEQIIPTTEPVKCPSTSLNSGSVRVRISGNVTKPYKIEVVRVVAGVPATNYPKVASYDDIDDTDNNVAVKQTLASLSEADYKIILKKDGCTIEKPFRIEQLPTLELVSVTPSKITCADPKYRNIEVVVRGGALFPSGNYHFDIYHGATLATKFDASKVTPTKVNEVDVTIGGKTFKQIKYSIQLEDPWVSTLTQKQYKVEVIDANQCISNRDITVKRAEKPSFGFSVNPADCNLTAGKITFTLDNPNLANDYTIKYSIRKKQDDGTWINNWKTYQSSNEFAGLETGDYQLRVQYTDGGVTCYYPEDVTAVLNEDGTTTVPNPLPVYMRTIETTIGDGGGPVRAFVGVIKLACNIGTVRGATVRVSNISGGEHIGGGVKYQIKFGDNPWQDDVTTFTDVAPGTYAVRVRGKNQNCEYTTTITVEPPLALPNVTSSLAYDCEGKGIVTLTPDNTNYAYSYDQTVPTTWQNNTNAFVLPNKYTPGQHTIKVFYKNKVASSANVLIKEDFGFGASVPVSGLSSNASITPNFTYVNPLTGPGCVGWNEYTIISKEDFDKAWWGAGARCSGHTGSHFWISEAPSDHSGLTKGRYMYVDMGTNLGTGEVLYEQTVSDVIPNQPIKFEAYIMSLVKASYSGYAARPNFRIKITNATGTTTLGELTSGDIPHNSLGHTAWERISSDVLGTINPGNNTTIKVQIINTKNDTAGNDFVIDDIYVYQEPEACQDYQEVTINVLADKHFDFNSASETKKDVSCHGGNDGSYQIQVKNFDTTTGFKYRLLKGGAPHTPTTAGQYNQTSTGQLSFTSLDAGNYRLEIKFDDTNANCVKTKDFTITQPDELKVTLNTTNINALSLNCGEAQRQVRVTSLVAVVGGTAPYKYTLTKLPSTNVTIDTQGFALLGAGNYQLHITDTRNCNTATSSKIVPFEVKQRQKPSIALTRESCPRVGATPSGTNVKVVVTPDVNSVSATLTYKIKLSTDAVYTTRLSNSSLKNYTFDNLAAGTYDIQVEDQYGCSEDKQITVYEPFGATAQATSKHKCGPTSVETKGKVTVNAVGGSGTYQYAYMRTNATPTDADFVTSDFKEYDYNTTTETVYVWAKDTTTGCTFQIPTPLQVVGTLPTAYTIAPTNPDCVGGEGKLVVTITQGAPSYTILVTDAVGIEMFKRENTTDTTFTINNLVAGTYTIKVTDVNGCEVTDTGTITDPILEGTIEDINTQRNDCNPPQSALGFKIVLDATSTTTGYTIKYSKDNGVNWETSAEFMNIAGGTTVYPVIGRFKGNTLVCKKEFGAYITKIAGGIEVNYTAMTPTAGCVSSYSVPVKIGNEVYHDVKYALDSSADAAFTHIPTGSQADGYSYTFTNLIPGRQYTIYVRYKKNPTDTQYCISSTSVDFTNVRVQQPSIKAVPTPVPLCVAGTTRGDIEYALTGGSIGNVTYELRQIDPTTGADTPVTGITFAPSTLPSYNPAVGATVRVTNVPTSATILYYLKITETTGNCVSASPSTRLEQITANPINFAVPTPITLNCKDNGAAVFQATGGSGQGFTFVILKDNAAGTQVLRRDIRSNTPNVALSVNDFTAAFLNANPYPTSVTLRVKAIDRLTRCEDQKDLVVNFTPKPTFTVSVQNCNLPYRITIDAGAGNYMYSIDEGNNWFPRNILDVPVNFTPSKIRVLDVNTGCIGLDRSPTATQPIVFPAFSAAARLSAMPTTCTDQATIAINIESGSSEYEYVIFKSDGTEVVRQTVTGSGANGKVASVQTHRVDAGDTYRVEITDKKRGAQSCAVIRQTNIVVERPVAPELEFEVVAPTCNGATDGQIIAKIKKATHTQGVYTFEIDGASGTQNTFNDATYTGVIFSGLGARVATYAVKVTSKYGCSDTENITITEPTVLAATQDATRTDVQFACSNVLGQNKARLTLKASGGTSPHRYSIDNINWVEKAFTPGTDTEHTFEIQDIGADQTITWYVTDKNNCNVQTNTYTLNTRSVITSNVDLTLNSSTDRMKCGSGERVKIKFVANRETTLGYEVTLASGPVGATLAPVMILPADRTTNAPGAHTYEKVITLPEVAGNYTLTITDKDTNCTYTSVNYLVNQVEKPTLTATAKELCFGRNEVTIDLTFTGNVGSGYTYDIYKGTSITPIETGLSTPSHTFVTTAPVEGTYRIVAKMIDTNCEVETTVTVLVADNDLDIKAKIVKEVSFNCTTNTFNADGIIEVTSVSGGWGPEYLYSLKRGSTGVQTTWSSQTRYENLEPDTYEIFVKDKNGCDKNSNTIVLNQPTQLSVSGATPVTETPVVCFGGNEGTATLTGVIGGSGVYSYTLFNEQGQVLQSSRDNIPDTTNPGKYVKGAVKFEGLTEGEYRIRVTDELFHCSIPVEVTARISGPLVIKATAGIELYSDCGVNGDIKITAAGGNAPFNYTYQRVDAVTNNAIGTPNNTGIFTGIIDHTTDGTYKFLVTDDKGCIGYSNIIAVDAVNPLAINVDSVDDKLKCNSDRTGRIVVSATGGSTDKSFLYELLDNASNPVLDLTGTAIISQTGAFDNLPAGTYKVKVTKGNNCAPAFTTDIIIKANPIYTATAQKTDVTCNGLNNGTYNIELDITAPLLDGDTRRLEYAISPRLDRFMSFTGDKLELKDLEPGDYVVIVQDQNGCRPDFAGKDIFEFSIVEPPVFSVLVTPGSILHEGCKGASNGQVKLNILGGRPYEDASVSPIKKYYKYSLTSATDEATYQEYDPNQGIKNLPAGTNTIWVKDENGCEAREITVEINEGTDLQESAVVQYTCNNTNVMSNKVIVSVNPAEVGNVVYYSTTAIPATSSGSPTNNPQFTFPAVALGSPAQTHTIYVVLKKRNHQICEVPITVTIEGKASLTWVSETINDVLCNGESTGKVEVTISGGSGNYEYAIAPNEDIFVSSNVFDNLSAGFYPITVRDKDYNCVITKTIEVKEPAVLNIKNLTETALICPDVKDGTITFIPEGGLPNTTVGEKRYKYEVYLLSKPSQKVKEEDIEEQPSGEVKVKNLSEGRYVLKVIDINNCSIQRIFEIQPAPDLKDTKVQLVYTCGKPAVYGEAQTQFDIPTYAIWVTFPTQDIDRSLIKYTLIDVTTDSIVSGYNQKAFTRFDSNDTAVIENEILPEGKYVMQLFYGTCPKALRQIPNIINIKNYADMVIDDVSITTEENTIRVTVNGGNNEVEEVDESGNRVVEYEEVSYIDPLTGETKKKTRIKDIKMKQVPYNVYFVNPKYTLIQDLTTKHHQYNAFLPDASNTNVSYLIQKGDDTRIDADGKEYKKIRVYVEDAQGCGYYIDIEREFIDIDIPNYFTPNGDGDNDIWYPKHIENYPNALIQIYDRYGRPIAKLKPGEGWNGQYKGKELPAGDYWYIVNLNEPDDERVFKGHFTLYR